VVVAKAIPTQWPSVKFPFFYPKIVPPSTIDNPGKMTRVETLLTHSPQPSLPPNWPLLRLGFRPFYLGVALLACLSIPVWIAAFTGHMAWTLPMPPLLWHAHEMLFGFGAGTVIGFLLTAVRAWTGLDTARGPLLAALALLWLAARLAALAAPYPLYAALDVALLPTVAAVLLRVLYKGGNRRNMPLVALLLCMAAANAAFHLSVLRLISAPAMTALHAQLALLLMVISVIAGRVVPMFTRNVTPGLVIRTPPVVERLLLPSTALALLLWLLHAPALPATLVSAVAAALHAVRLWGWQPWVTRQRPILWILHAAYAWLPLGFALLALAQQGHIAPTLAIHAFAVGAMGGLIIGMMTRTARGHTGRPLQATRAEVLAYSLVLAAAALRVLLPVVWPQAQLWALQTAALLWAAAFALYLWVYTPWLLRARVDGKDG